MPRLNTIQKLFLKELLSRVLYFPAIWFFFWAIYPLATTGNMMIYVMTSMFNWLLFIVSLVVMVFIDLLWKNPDVRNYFRHIERGAAQKKVYTPKPESQKQKEKKKQKPVFY